MPATVSGLHYPSLRELLPRTRLAYVHLRNLLSDAKRDRAARVSGYVAIWLPEEFLVLYLQRGELVNACLFDGQSFQAIAIGAAVDKVPAEPEYGEITFCEAEDEQLSCMFASQLTPPEPWRNARGRQSSSAAGAGASAAGAAGASWTGAAGRDDFVPDCFLAGAATAAVGDAARGGTDALAPGDAAGARGAAGDVAAVLGSGAMILIGGVEAAEGNSALVGFPVGIEGGSAATTPGDGGGAFQTAT